MLKGFSEKQKELKAKQLLKETQVKAQEQKILRTGTYIYMWHTRTPGTRSRKTILYNRYTRQSTQGSRNQRGAREKPKRNQKETRKKPEKNQRETREKPERSQRKTREEPEKIQRGTREPGRNQRKTRKCHGIPGVVALPTPGSRSRKKKR